MVALLGFVGCDPVFGIHSTGLLPPNQEVGYVNTAITSPLGTSTTTFNATLSGLKGGELIVVTLQWKGNPPTFTPNLASAAGPYQWQLEATVPPKTVSDIQVFTALNPAGQTQFNVRVELTSVVPWSICLSAYNTVDVEPPPTVPSLLRFPAAATTRLRTSRRPRSALAPATRCMRLPLPAMAMATLRSERTVWG